MNCYHHFTIEERTCLRKYYMEGLSFRKIAKLLGRSPSSISREIMRNRSFINVKPAYYPHTAHKKYLFRRRFCHRGMFGNEQVVENIFIQTTFKNRIGERYHFTVIGGAK